MVIISFLKLQGLSSCITNDWEERHIQDQLHLRVFWDSSMVKKMIK